LYISFVNSATAENTTLNKFYVLGSATNFYIESAGNGVFNLIC
jgi:hypothetical protein